MFSINNLSRRSLNVVMMFCNGVMLGRHHQQKKAIGCPAGNLWLLGYVIEAGLNEWLKEQSCIPKTNPNSLTLLVAIIAEERGLDGCEALVPCSHGKGLGCRKQVMEKIILEMLCVTHLRIRMEQEQRKENTNQREMKHQS